MEAKFTPRPWTFDAESGVVENSEGDVILDVDWSSVEDAQLDANGHLIAAAPELYEACMAMRRMMYSPDSKESRMADAALAKARGEQPQEAKS